MDDIHAQIIKALSGEKKPLMIKAIAEMCNLNPQTIARRLDSLELLGRVRKIQIGHAKKYYLIDAMPVSGLIDICSDLIIILNANYVIQYINHSAEKLLGLENRQIIGERLEFLNLDIFSSPAVMQGLRKFNPEKVFRTEIPYTRDGSLHWYYISIMSLALKVNTLSIAILAGDVTEKKLAEERLKESEAKYRLISENSEDVIWLLDVQSMQFSYVSPSVSGLLGYISEEVMETPLEEFIKNQPDRLLLHFLPHRIKEFLSKDESARTQLDEIDLIHKNGMRVPTEMVTTLLTDETGAVTNVLGVSRNISERRSSERALQKSQEHANILSDILERSFQPILVLYPDQTIDYCNGAFEELFGYTRDELSKFEIICPGEWENWKIKNIPIIEKVNQTGEAVQFQRILLHKNGTQIPIEMTIHLIRDPEGNILRYYGFVTDITERNRTEEKIRTYQVHLEELVQERTKNLQKEINARIKTEIQLRESEERFRQVAENAGEWIWEIDNEGVYRYCSPGVHRIIGYTPEELVGRMFSELYPPDTRGELLSIVRSVTGRQECFRQFQVPMVHKNGSVIRVETSGSPVYNADGIITGYRGIYADITEQTRMERSLLESKNYNRFLFEDSPVPLVLIDADLMIYLDFNKSALRFYGSTSAELGGRRVGILSTPSGTEPEYIPEHIHRCLKEGRDSYESRYLKKNGEVWYGLVSLVRFEHGKKNRILVSFQDPIKGPDNEDKSSNFK